MTNLSLYRCLCLSALFLHSPFFAPAGQIAQAAPAAKAPTQAVKAPAGAKPMVKALLNKNKAPAPLEIHDKWAVLVGVAQYQDAGIQEKLAGQNKFAGGSVMTLTKTFINPDAGRFLKDHVLVATGGKATKENLANAIYQDWLIKKALPNHLLVLYLGTAVVPTDDKSDLLVLPVDADLKNKENTALSLSGMLGELKRRSQCKNILVMLDGKSLDDAPVGDIVNKICQSTGASFMLSDKDLLTARNDDMARASSFVSYVSEGIKAGGGFMPIETVAGFVDESLSKSGQTPLQKPVFVVGEVKDLGKQAFGLKIKQPFDAKNVKVGHPLDTLAAKRPDLDAALSPSLKAPIVKREQEDEADDNDDKDTDLANVNFDSYMSQMKKSIQSKWSPPRDANQKTVIAVFSIFRDGSIKEAEIVESSGQKLVDQSALQALKDASPLAPLPKGAPPHIQIRYKFDWKVSAQN